MDQRSHLPDSDGARRAPARLLTPPERQRMMRSVLEATDLALTGRLADAIRMLANSPDVRADAFGSTRLGSLCFQAGDVQGALGAFDRAIALQADCADAHCNRGVALQKLRRVEEALAAYEAAVKYEPANVNAHFNRGNVLAMLGRLDEAAGAFSQTLVLDPMLADAGLNLGFVKLAGGNLQAALAAFEKVLAIDPDHAEAAKARLSTLRQMGRAPQPLPPAPRTPPPPGAEATLARSRVLIELGRCRDALKLLAPAPPPGPIGARLMAARSAALWRMGRHDEGLAAARAAVDLAPDDAEIHEEYAYLCLKAGDFARGWEEYEHRLAKPFGRMRTAEQSAPVWRGENLAGKRIRVLTEQGYGDTLQFVRYLALLLERGAAISAVVRPALRSLLGSMKTPVDWNAAPASGADDYHIHLMSLPQRFGTRLDSIPNAVPYLFADPGKAAAWRSRIGDDGLRVGVVWQGNPNQGTDHLRSIALASFAPLASVPRVRLISLQAVHGLDQLVSLPQGMAVEDLGPAISDNPDGMSEIAAVMAGLDLVVSSDTAIAHLAGALGRPVWLALHHDPDWRWLRARSDSPWYPTMRLFRQRKPGDWAGVFSEMAQTLGKAAAAGPTVA